MPTFDCVIIDGMEIKVRSPEEMRHLLRLEQRAERAEAERDEARRQIAALREVAQMAVDFWATDSPNELLWAIESGLPEVLADTAAAVQAHDAAVRRAALEEASKTVRYVFGARCEDVADFLWRMAEEDAE